MKKKIFICFIISALIAIIGFSVASIRAAECSNGTLTCSGECCYVTTSSCKAGPCDVINGEIYKDFIQ